MMTTPEAHAISMAKDDILDDLAAGRYTGGNVRTFADLHDHVDANEYIPDDFTDPEVANTITDALDEWIRSGDWLRDYIAREQTATYTVKRHDENGLSCGPDVELELPSSSGMVAALVVAQLLTSPPLARPGLTLDRVDVSTDATGSGWVDVTYSDGDVWIYEVAR